MNSILKKSCKGLVSVIALKAGKKVYRNGGILGGLIAGIIAVGILASGIQKKRKRQQKHLLSSK